MFSLVEGEMGHEKYWIAVVDVEQVRHSHFLIHFMPRVFTLYLGLTERKNLKNGTR